MLGTVVGGVTSRKLGNGGNIIWNTSWGAADKAAIQSRDVGITNAVKSVYGHAETIPTAHDAFIRPIGCSDNRLILVYGDDPSLGRAKLAVRRDEAFRQFEKYADEE